MAERFDRSTAQGNDAVCFASVDELSAQYRSGALSPVEVVQTTLMRISRVNPVLNAYYQLDESGALEAARESEARHRRGEALGPLDGIPVSIKDHIDVTGMASP